MNEDGSTMLPVRREGLIDQVAASFRAEIVSGRWPVNSQIPTEAALVASSGAGRNTVREAVQSLVHAGLLRREQGRGTFVISKSELSGPLRRQLHGGTRRDYLELRLALDSTAASLAAVRRTESDVLRLRDLRDRRAASWSSRAIEDRAVADLALHRGVVEATHNPLYLTLYDSLLEIFTDYMHDEEVVDEDPASREHHELVEAIAAGDSDRAAALTIGIFDPIM